MGAGLKVDRNEALAGAEKRLNTLVAVFGLIIVLVFAGMAALWYYGTSRRATEAAERFRTLARRYEHQRNFMHLVTDSQPNTIAIFDEGGHYRWFNQRTLEESGLKRPDLYDKHVSAILGPIEGRRISRWVSECLERAEAFSVTHEFTRHDGKSSVLRSDFIPLPDREDYPPSVLTVSQDITESVREREKREALMRSLVNTLVSVVDRRDPYSAHHSTRVAEVSRAIATEMGLDKTLIETASTAGSLMNLGKITVPASVLTKEGPLTDKEKEIIRRSIEVSAELLSGLDFEGPVAETLAQLQEHMDGSGVPNHLKGEQILPTARVAAVANAFVGMVSVRSWRGGLPIRQAIETLLQDSNRRFDRAVVLALANYVENKGGMEQWADFGKHPDSRDEKDA